MKTLVWTVCALLVAVWTGTVAAVLGLTEWLLVSVAAGAGGEAGAVASAAWGDAVGRAMAELDQWPVPAWLAPWIDTAGWEALAATMLGALQWLGQVWPDVGSLMAWLTPLAWVAWGLVVLMLLALAALVHWLLNRAAAASSMTAAGEAVGAGDRAG
jgi:hypothetical protein